MTFSEKIVRLRKLKSLTQDEFASAVGVSRQAVYKWESGQSYPEVPKLLEIKLLFGISIDDLLDDTYEVELPEKKKRKRISRADKERIEAEVRAEEQIASQTNDVVSENVEEPVLTQETVPVQEIAEVEEVTVEVKAAAEAEQVAVAEEPASVESEAVDISVPEDAAENVLRYDDPAITSNDAEAVAAAINAKKPEKRGFFSRLFGKK